MPRWASSFAAIASWTDSGGLAGSPVPPSSRQVARENWYLPRYWPRGRDRGRVAAGLALGDPGERAEPRSSPVDWRLRLRGRRGAEMPRLRERRRAGDAVDGEAVVALVVADRAPRDRSDHAVGGHAERALERDRCRRRSRRSGRRSRRGRQPRPRRRRRGSWPRAARAPPPRPARFRRRSRAASARRRREALSDASHGPGFAGSMKGTATSWVSVPTGLAVGLALRPALRRHQSAIRPGRRSASGSPVPRHSVRRGLGLVFS